MFDFQVEQASIISIAAAMMATGAIYILELFSRDTRSVDLWVESALDPFAKVFSTSLIVYSI